MQYYSASSPISQIRANNFLFEFDQCIDELFPSHPFDSGISIDNFERVISEYLAMSISFPYIQAGAIYNNYRLTIDENNDINKNVEITSAIGSFLVFDEFGCYAQTQKFGNDGLRNLTNVGHNFHSNLLRRDIETLLGKRVKPVWSDVTNAYLSDLLAALSDQKLNRNIAYMIAFENHANRMIMSLWNAIHLLFNFPKDSKLSYFYGHVGGESPAEAFHVEMTQRMIEDLVPEVDVSQFISSCIKEYTANISWCERILSLSNSDKRIQKDA